MSGKDAVFKKVCFHGVLNERTGYGIHGSRFVEALEKLIPVDRTGLDGDVHITLVDVVSIQNITTRLPYPSICYSVWESTEYPSWFIEKLKLFDKLWVPSEWQRACSIAQGIPEEFVQVVPEGVDPDIYKPAVSNKLEKFTFVHCGQWQPRKSTLEIIQAFQRAFPCNQNVCLQLSVDTLFPSDEYKSTEERLVANGIDDPRIIPIHFEERDDYIRRLQNADCFVSCSRSEGWGLPIIEAIAVGVPTIVSDWGGSTEYHAGAIAVPIRKLIKPFGIYGGWDVPGQWCEPDFDKLAEAMQDVYNNHAKYKESALKLSDKIRKDFSWDAAAAKAFAIINKLQAPEIAKPDPEMEIMEFARKKGFEITSMRKPKIIFVVDCHPSSMERVNTLVETVKQIKAFGYPVLVTAHLPLPQPAIEEADFYIYDKRDILSGDDLPVYSRTGADGQLERKAASIPCHALAWLHNMRNAIDFCKGKYDWIYNMSSDAEVDLKEWLEKVKSSNKDLIATKWEGAPGTFNGQLIAGRPEMYDRLYPRLETWAEFAEMFGGDRFCCERGYYKRAESLIGLENIDFIDMEIGNRFNQVDYNVWPDDTFFCNFIDGPNLTISGISMREYDVRYTTPDGKAQYQVMQKPGMISRAGVKYHKDWTITAYLDGQIAFRHHMNLTGQRVLISLGSKALGDTIAWMPYVEEFRKKHNCHVLCSGWWQEIFDYPEIEFVKPGSQVPDIYATYQVGCFDDQLSMNKANWRTVALQQVASDILGLDYEPIKARLKFTPHKRGNGGVPEPYICFSEYSTMQNKMWNREGAWQNVIDHCNSLGYKCVSVSAEPTQLNNVVKHNSQSIQNTIADVAGSEFYIGLNHGPAWIAYALGIPCLMITGVSEEWNDFPNPYRIAINHDVCGVGCFNDPALPIDRGWSWCPRGKDFVCTKEITETMVYEKIGEIGGYHATQKRVVKKNDKQKHQRTDAYREVSATPSGGNRYGRSGEI